MEIEEIDNSNKDKNANRSDEVSLNQAILLALAEVNVEVLEGEKENAEDDKKRLKAKIQSLEAKNQSLGAKNQSLQEELKKKETFWIDCFPTLKNDNLLRAAKGEDVGRIPVCFMQKASRYLPEFKEVEKSHGFFNIYQTPELACKVSMQPIRRFDLDACMIFSNILVIPWALGMNVDMNTERIHEPLNALEDFKKFPESIAGVLDRLNYIQKAIVRTRNKLDGKVPLIGFTLAPWTLMGYMIEGGENESMSKAKRWLTEHNKKSHELLSFLTDLIVEYCKIQVDAGAQMLQVFEPSAKYIDKEQFAAVSLQYVGQIRQKLQEKLKDKFVPMMLYAKGAGHSLEKQAKSGYEVIGLDSTVNPIEARQKVGADVTLQSYLSPADMILHEVDITAHVDQMVQKFGMKRYIINFGDETKSEIPIEKMNALVKMVHGEVVNASTSFLQ